MAETRFTQPRLPILRFYSLLMLLLFADFVVSITLWLTGGYSKYMEDNVVHFHFDKSVFDLAAVSFVKCIILAILYSSLETATMALARDPLDSTIKRKRTVLFISSLLISFAAFSFSIVKGVFVYLAHKGNNSIMHVEYLALVISSIVFSSLELIAFFVNIYVLRHLRVRLVGMINDEESYSSSENGRENGKQKKKSKVNIARLASLAKPEANLIFWGTIALLVSTGSNMLAPLYFGKVIDAATNHDMTMLNTTILILFGVYSIGGIAGAFRAWLYTLAGQRLVARLRKELFAHILTQEVAFFDTNRTGELMNRLSSDSQVIQNAATVNISMLTRYLLQIIGSLVIMFIVSPRLTGVLLAVIPLVAIGAQRYGAYVQGLQKKFQDELAKSASTAEEAISSLRTVRSFSQEPKSCQQYDVNINQSYEAGKKVALGSGIFNGGFSIIAQGAIVLVLWYGGKLVHDGGMSVGSLTSFIFYTLTVAMAFAFLASLYGDFMQAVGASTRIFELFDRKSALEDGSLTLPSIKQAELKFENVTFTYPSRPDSKILSGLSFKIMPGETVALVGPSGGGKSTIISLLERFYDPDEGTIYVGNTPLRDLDMEWYRKKIVIVSQEPVLFATTIAENIAYGKDSSEEEIVEAAKRANAHNFIEAFEEKYHTSVGERGIKLSGGQKQRVAIARALVMDPDILLLDEATSALDAESEFLVQEAIDRAMVGRTVLVIAHRLSTVRNASRVVVIDKGTIAEQGTHEELIALNGVYKKLVLRQLTAGEVNADTHYGDTPVDSPIVRRRQPRVQNESDDEKLIDV